MPQVIIQPAFGNPMARRHWNDMVDRPVRFTALEEFERLPPRTRQNLHELHPNGEARFWGVTRNHDERMTRVSTGDIVLFTGGKHLRGIGELGVVFRSSMFATALWHPDSERGSFRNVYSLTSFRQVMIPYEEIWELPSFKTGDNFMGLRLLSADKGAEILDGLRIEPLGSRRAQNERDRRLVESLAHGSVIAAEAIHTVVTGYQRAEGTVAVNRIEALLVREYARTVEDRVVGRFRTPDGHVADLLVRDSGGMDLIEAKSSTGRHDVRQALGQLFDYAPHSPEPLARLSVLLPTSPDDPSIGYLHRYGVDCIYLEKPGLFRRDPAPADIRAYQRRLWSRRA